MPADLMRRLLADSVVGHKILDWAAQGTPQTVAGINAALDGSQTFPQPDRTLAERGIPNSYLRLAYLKTMDQRELIVPAILDDRHVEILLPAPLNTRAIWAGLSPTQPFKEAVLVAGCFAGRGISEEKTFYHAGAIHTHLTGERNLDTSIDGQEPLPLSPFWARKYSHSPDRLHTDCGSSDSETGFTGEMAETLIGPANRRGYCIWDPPLSEKSLAPWVDQAATMAQGGMLFLLGRLTEERLRMNIYVYPIMQKSP